MNKMNHKIWRNIKKTVCAACLSRNRRLILANEVEQLKEVFPDLKFGQSDMICWECKALAKKVLDFKSRTHMAHDIYIDICKKLIMLEDVETLSRLSKFKTDDKSYIYLEYEEDFKPTLVVQQLNKLEYNLYLKHEPEDSGEKPENPEYQEVVAIEFPKVEINSKEEDEISMTSIKEEKTEPVDKLIHLSDVDQKTGERYNNYIKVIMLSESELEKIRIRKGKYQKSSYKCLSCVESFKDKAALDTHNVKHSDKSGKFSCNICKQRMLSQKELDDHTLLHFRCFECLLCAYKSLDYDSALRHYNHSHHKQALKCDHCSKTFQTVKQLKLHKRTQNCPECGKTYKQSLTLKAHIMVVHRGLQMVECPVCHKKLLDNNYLKKHMKTHDVKVDDPFCAECCIRFKSIASYKAHITTSLKHVSPDDLKFKCPHCEKRFRKKSSMKIHSVVHTDETKYNCHLCDQAFKTQKRMRYHINTKHEGKVMLRNKVCDICGKAFNCKGTLDQHMNTHLGHRPYLCDVCSDSFSFSGALYTHKRLKHGKKRKEDGRDGRNSAKETE